MQMLMKSQWYSVGEYSDNCQINLETSTPFFQIFFASTRCKEIDDRDDELVYRHEVWRMEHELKETRITNIYITDFVLFSLVESWKMMKPVL